MLLPSPHASAAVLEREVPLAVQGKVSLWWTRVRDSLWFVPGVVTIAAIALAMVMVHVDRVHEGPWAVLAPLIFGGGAEGARGVLSAIAGSLITVTGVVFSVTIVALQLASSQFTPRVLRSFVADRTNQVVLGVFIGTFTYALLVLRTVRSAAEDGAQFVPELAVTLSVVLLLVSVGALIVFIDHAARSIQASVILQRETTKGLHQIAERFPDAGGPGAGREVAPWELPAGAARQVVARRAGYVQTVEAERLFELARERRLVVRVELQVGGFVLPGEPLASVWPAELPDDEVENSVRESFSIGSERTHEQDVELGFIKISDIAVKALSPGINDPTTAHLCIDRLGELLVALGRRQVPGDARVDDEGTLRLVAGHLTFERAMGLAFDQIRHYGASNPAIAKKLLDTIRRVAVLVPARYQPALSAQAEATLHAARQSIDIPVELAEVERVGAGALEGIACTVVAERGRAGH